VYTSPINSLKNIRGLNDREAISCHHIGRTIRRYTFDKVLPLHVNVEGDAYLRN
jgi:hypothetical protein